MKDLKESLFYIESNSNNPYYNLALEEYLLCNYTEGDILFLWQNDNTIVVGQNQNTLAEINEEYVREHGIHVVRRATGGGAVFHDLGNINYSFISGVMEGQALSFARFSSPLVQALLALGLDAQVGGRNDITVMGKKISGTAQRIHHGRVLFHGTLLFDSDASVISKALKVDELKFRGKSTKSVRSRVGNIRDFLKEDMDTTAFFSYIKEYLTKDGVENITLSDAELKCIRELEKNKYSSWEWNYKKSPEYETTRKAKFDGGIIELSYTVSKGIITNISFTGDFLSRKSLEDIYNRFLGLEFKDEVVAYALSEIKDLDNYFGDITKEEILSLFR